MWRSVAVLAVLGVAACSTGSPTPLHGASAGVEEAVAARHIILRFKDRRAEAEARASLDALGAAVGEPLIYVRPLSGGAHLISPASTLPDGAFRLLLQRLAAHETLEYSVPERRITHMPKDETR